MNEWNTRKRQREVSKTDFMQAGKAGRGEDDAYCSTNQGTRLKSQGCCQFVDISPLIGHCLKLGFLLVHPSRVVSDISCDNGTRVTRHVTLCGSSWQELLQVTRVSARPHLTPVTTPAPGPGIIIIISPASLPTPGDRVRRQLELISKMLKGDRHHW